MKSILGLVVLSAGLTGCAVTIDTRHRVPGWPELKIVEHHVAADEMFERCRRFVPPSSAPEGCTLFYFDRGEAHIYVNKEAPNGFVLRHERLHAEGYDHVGSDHMRRALEAWRAQRVALRAETPSPEAGAGLSLDLIPRVPR
jgi:hypothetical protein